MDLDATLAAIKKAYGSDAILTLDDAEFAGESFSSGCTALDIALSCGGWPRGRMVEIFGPESAGKSTLTLHAVSSCQKNLGLRAAIIDYEHAVDPIYAEALGVDLKKLFIAQPTTAEEGVDIMTKLIKTKEFGLVVGDSVAAMTTKQQLEGNIGDANIASLARLLSQEVKQLVAAASTYNSTVMWVNQLR